MYNPPLPSRGRFLLATTKTQYLGLRLFAHPWDREGSDFRKGPGDGLADALGDPCLLDLFQEDGSDGGGGGGRDKSTDKVADTLRKVGDLSEWMRLRAAALLKEENKKGMEAGGRRVGTGGSCAFNLTLINRMECSAAKRDLKPDPLFAMGKCSVSWHADSCLQDFSTIGMVRMKTSRGCIRSSRAAADVHLLV